MSKVLTQDEKTFLVIKDLIVIIHEIGTKITGILIVDHVINHVNAIFRDTGIIRVDETLRVGERILIQDMDVLIREIKVTLKIMDLTGACRGTEHLIKIGHNLEIEIFGAIEDIRGTETKDKVSVEGTLLMVDVVFGADIKVI